MEVLTMPKPSHPAKGEDQDVLMVVVSPAKMAPLSQIIWLDLDDNLSEADI